MPLFRDQSAKGRWIKLGLQWVKLSEVTAAVAASDAQGRFLRVTRRGKPPVVYRGKFVDHCRAVVDREKGR